MDKREIESVGEMLLKAKDELGKNNVTHELWMIHERLAYCFEKMADKPGSIYGLPSTVGKFKKEG